MALILSLSYAPPVMAGNAVELKSNGFRVNNNIQPLTINNINNINTLNTDNEILNYTDMLKVLLETKEDNQPRYILLNGSGGNLSTYSYTISNNYHPPDGYHNLNDNYKLVPLDNNMYDGTILSVKKNYNLKTEFYVNNNENINLTNWVIFNKDIKSTQMLHTTPMELTFPDFPYTEKEINIIFMNPVFDIAMIGPAIVAITTWISQVTTAMTNIINKYALEADDISAQNYEVAKHRGEIADRYWYPDIFNGRFENIDDGQLDIMMVYICYIKINLNLVKTALEGADVILGTAIAAFNFVVTSVPSDFGMDKPIKYTLNTMQAIQASLKAAAYFGVTVPYNRFDRESFYITGEEHYRKGIKEGSIKPHDPTPDEIAEENIRIDQEIKDINTRCDSEQERIFNPDYMKNLTDVYNDQCIYIYNKIDFYKKQNTNHQYDKVIEVYTNQLKECEAIRDNAEGILTLNDVEKGLWDDYSGRIDKQIHILESMKR
jgi:hypothetical protein